MSFNQAITSNDNGVKYDITLKNVNTESINDVPISTIINVGDGTLDHVPRWNSDGLYPRLFDSGVVIDSSDNLTGIQGLIAESITVDGSPGYDLPTQDGSAGQVLTTDGAGTTSFQDTGDSSVPIVVNNTSLATHYIGMTPLNTGSTDLFIDTTLTYVPATDRLTVSSISTDNIYEKTTNNGVAVDGLQIKDGAINSTSGTNVITLAQLGTMSGIAAADIIANSNLDSSANISCLKLLTNTFHTE